MSPVISDKVAVLGLGIIGSRVYSRLADAGWNVTCWNRTPKGVSGEAGSAGEAVREAAVVALYLKDGVATREVVGGISGELQAGQILLSHSTLDLETTRWLQEIAKERGCQFLDAPFTGSKVAAGKGQLVYYIGGDPALAERLEPLLSVSSKSRVHCGPVGAATVVKLATNLISACTVQAMAEALAITTGHGVSADCLVQAVEGNVSASTLAAMKFPSMLAGDYETHFSMSNMGKDSRYMLELAESAGVETPAIAAVSKRLGDLCAEGMGELDFSALAKPYLESC